MSADEKTCVLVRDDHNFTWVWRKHTHDLIVNAQQRKDIHVVAEGPYETLVVLRDLMNQGKPDAYFGQA